MTSTNHRGMPAGGGASAGAAPSDYLFFRGSALYQLGCLDEASQILRRSLGTQTNPARKIVCRNQLSRVLMSQGRWDDAEACFRECIAESPKHGGNPCALAELLLRRGQPAALALDAARSAVALDRVAAIGPKLDQENYDLNLAESLTVLAWALARNQADRSEIRSALDEALHRCPPTTKPVFAEIHYFAGQACALLSGEPFGPAEAARHFQTAAAADPAGNYGRLSQAALAPH